MGVPRSAHAGRDSDRNPQEANMFETHQLGTAESDSVFGEVISTYTRKQAIEDGLLIDVSETAKEAGFRVPVAVTQAVWEDCCEWDEKDARRHYQDVSGRLWDVIYMARLAISRAHGTQLIYGIYRIPRVGHGRKRNVRLKLVSGPGDEGEHVITIMQPQED